MIEISVRPALPSDLEFVFKTWIKTCQRSSPTSINIPKEIFYLKHHALIERILLRPTTSIYIAHPKGEPDILLGYLVYEKQDADVVHFMFVKKQFRRLGIGRQLTQHAKIDHAYLTHWTKWTDHTWGKFNLTYDPYRI